MNCFLNNKYTKIYYQIINKAKSRAKPEGYTEKHHIIPKCMDGKEVIPLTFREHFICHHLLIKMCKTSKQKWSMYHAFDLMGKPNKNQSDRIINSKMFERIKIINKTLCSGVNHWAYGKTGKLCPNYKKKNALGYKHTNQWKKERSENRTGKCFLTDEIKNQIANKLSHKYQVICPNGLILFIKNLKKFCRESKINSGRMTQVVLGKESHHKGYVVIEIKNKKDILSDKQLQEKQKQAIVQHPLRLR
jgi:hypothetical protein